MATRKPSAGKPTTDKPRIHSSTRSLPKRAAAGAKSPVKAPPKAPAKAQKRTSLGPPPPAEATKHARDLALLCAAAGLEKKALNVEIVDVAGRVDYADYIVLMTGTSDRHVASLVQGIEDDLKKAKHRPIAVEGMPQASWVLIDYGDVVVHVFQSDSRSLYDIDGLWMDAGRVPVPGRANDSKR